MKYVHRDIAARNCLGINTTINVKCIKYHSTGIEEIGEPGGGTIEAIANIQQLRACACAVYISPTLFACPKSHCHDS